MVFSNQRHCVAAGSGRAAVVPGVERAAGLLARPARQTVQRIVAVVRQPAGKRHSREEADGRTGGAIGVSIELRLRSCRLW